MTDTTLRKIYFDLDDPASFTGVETLYQAAKRRLPDITKKAVREWLSQQESYTLHKPARKRFPRNSIIVTAIDALWELDLVDLSKHKKLNGGFAYLLQVIDVGSRFGFSMPLRTKKPTEVAAAFEKLMQRSGRRPIVCTFDAGKEFTGKAFQAMLKRNEIFSYVSSSDMKCSIIERWNRTLKSRMWRYFTQNNTYRWKDVLQKLVTGYNNATHRTIGCKPSEVTAETIGGIVNRLVQNSNLERPHSFKFDINDHVRISRSKGVFEKGFEPNWTREIFVITSRKAVPHPVYKIKDLNNESIKGIFYETQLQKVEKPPVYKIEKILRWRRFGGKRQAFVRYLGYGPAFDEWVNEENLVDL